MAEAKQSMCHWGAIGKARSWTELGSSNAGFRASRSLQPETSFVPDDKGTIQVSLVVARRALMPWHVQEMGLGPGARQLLCRKYAFMLTYRYEEQRGYVCIGYLRSVVWRGVLILQRSPKALGSIGRPSGCSCMLSLASACIFCTIRWQVWRRPDRPADFLFSMFFGAGLQRRLDAKKRGMSQFLVNQETGLQFSLFLPLSQILTITTPPSGE